MTGEDVLNVWYPEFQLELPFEPAPIIKHPSTPFAHIMGGSKPWRMMLSKAFLVLVVGDLFEF